MQRALGLLSGSAGEVPVGAVLVLDGLVLAESCNDTVAANNPLRHAEMRVLQAVVPTLTREQCRRAILYVTLEPCPMCMASLLACHIGTVVFAAYNLKWGACGTVANFQELFPYEACEVIGGICEAAATAVLHQFFHTIRTPEGASHV